MRLRGLVDEYKASAPNNQDEKLTDTGNSGIVTEPVQ